MNDKRTYLFDFDGTLVDSMPAFISLMLNILEEHQISYAEDIIKIITPLGYRGTAEYFRKLGIKKSADELVELMASRAEDEYTYRIPAKDGVIEALHKLKAHGADLNVLTASPHTALDPCLKRLGIYGLFTNVWSCDDFNTTKADPEIYKMAANRIGVGAHDVIFVDDNLNAVKTAKLAGLTAYGIYDPSSEDYVQEMKGVSDRYIEHFADLADFQN